MLAGLIYRGDYEMKLTVTGSGVSAVPSTGVAGGSCSLISHFTPDYFVKSVGIAMIGSGQTGATTEATAEIIVPALSVNEIRTYAGATSVVMETKLLDLFIYIETSGSFSLRCAGLEWRVNGTLEHSEGSFSLFSSMTGVPSAIPLIGIPPTMSPTTILDPLLSLGSCLPDDYPGGDEGNALTEASGGWRLKPHGGSYLALPISIPSNPLITGTTTYNVALTATYQQNNDPGYTSEVASGYSIWIIPDVPRTEERMGADFESLIYRWGENAYGIRSSTGTLESNCVGATITDTRATSDSTVYPAKSQLLSTVNNTPHLIEELFTSTQCWLNGGITTNFATETSVGFTNNGQQWLQLAAGSPSGSLGHLDLNARFVNQWLHPHWAYSLWFPPDSASSSVRWNLLGADSDIDYWYNVRQQHITHPSLPALEDTEKRVNVTADPINQNALVGLSQAVTGMPCWWGINRFTIETETFPTEFTTDSTSSSRFTFKNGASAGTGSVASSITIDAGSDAVEFDLTSFTVYPFMTTTLSDRLKITWADSNISAVKLFAVGVDGSSVQIGPTAGIISATTYRIPYGDSEKWATSAGADFGAGYLTDNHTADAGVSADDITAATLSDAQRISSFTLLPGFSPAKIRIEITRAGSYTGAVSISHPTFYQAPWADAECFHESGLVSTILFKDGPMVRYGALGFFDYVADAILSTPVPVASVANKTTIGDLWCWENVFLRGLSATSNLLARMNAEFVSGEEFPAGVTKHLWRYNDGETSFIDSVSGVVNSSIGPRLWYLNTFRSCPPLAIFPERKRSTGSGWVPDGDWGQFGYSDTSNEHPHIVPGSLQPQLIHAASDHLTLKAAPSGWQVATFSEAVDNNESQNWVLRWNSINWFLMRPWRGSASIFGLATFEPEGNVSCDVDISNTLAVRTLVASSLLQYEYTDTGRVWQTVDTGKECKWARVDIDDASRDRSIYIVIQTLSDEVELYRCTTFGDTLTLVRSYGSGTYPSIMIAPDGVRQIVWIESGAVKSVIEDAQDNIIEAEFTAYAAADSVGIDIAYDRKSVGSKGAVLVLVEGGTVKAFDSDDGGKTFT